MTTHPIPRRDDRKPDPSEPWRYVCPECKGQVQGHKRTRKFRCKTCGVTYSYESLYDRKHGRAVQEDTSGVVGKSNGV